MDLITNENVQVWTLYVTVVIALIGFSFNVFSIWQTKKATEDLAKPYVNIFVDAYAIKTSQRVYVIKNFGQTPAYIDKIEVLGQLDKNNEHAFQSLIGNMLAPGQKVTSLIEKDFTGKLVAIVTYHDQRNRSYTASFTLDTQLLASFCYATPESNESDTVPSPIRQSTMALLRDLR